jgi:hypothetical protein
MSLGISERVATTEETQRAALDNVFARLRVAMPGIIVSFDAQAQTAAVRPAIRERVKINGTEQNTDLPLLPDVPVVFPHAGGFCLTMPVIPGDECLVIFADMCIDGWWEAGGVQNMAEKRRHDLSDAFAILGPWSQPKRLAGYSAAAAQLRNAAGTVGIEISNTGVAIKGALTINGQAYASHTHTAPYNGGTTSGVNS